MKRHHYTIFLLFTFLLSLFTACTQIDVFEKNTSIPNYQWNSALIASGSFSITDTNAKYNAYLVLRHTDAYKYNNIWLNIGLQAPGDTMQYHKLNIELATDATGWEGSGMNDIWEVRRPLFPEPLKQRKGEYHFNIAQIMRDNPLLNIMSVGLRMEKVKQ